MADGRRRPAASSMRAQRLSNTGFRLDHAELRTRLSTGVDSGGFSVRSDGTDIGRMHLTWGPANGAT